MRDTAISVVYTCKLAVYASVYINDENVLVLVGLTGYIRYVTVYHRNPLRAVFSKKEIFPATAKIAYLLRFINPRKSIDLSAI